MQRPYLFRYFYWFSLLFLWCISGTSVHPFFISVTEIRLEPSKQTLNVSCRMFSSDLQDALLKLYQHQANLEVADNRAGDYLSKYINERLQIKVDGQPIAFRFAGYENEEESTWCYLEATAYPGNGKVQVNNGLLFDFISEQTNIIHFYRDGARTTTKLVNPERIAGF
jgi:hypothetical protein